MTSLHTPNISPAVKEIGCIMFYVCYTCWESLNNTIVIHCHRQVSVEAPVVSAGIAMFTSLHLRLFPTESFMPNKGAEHWIPPDSGAHINNLQAAPPLPRLCPVTKISYCSPKEHLQISPVIFIYFRGTSVHSAELYCDYTFIRN